MNFLVGRSLTRRPVCGVQVLPDFLGRQHQVARGDEDVSAVCGDCRDDL